MLTALFALTAEAASIRYARSFQIKPLAAGCRLVTVLPPGTAGETGLQYLLVPHNAPRPSGYSHALTIRVPVRRVVTLSTTHLAYIAAAGQVRRLAAVSDFRSINTPEIRHRIEANALVQVGDATQLRVEQLLDIDPDLILTSGAGTPFDLQPRLHRMGLPAVGVLEHLEPHPLGRCEWMKFLALFLGTEQHAEQLFAQVEKRYTELTALAARSPHRPAVLVNIPFQGQWWLPGGQSSQARMIRDVGGDYLWADLQRADTLPMNIEAVYDKGLGAEFWLHTGQWNRFASFRSVQSGQVSTTNGKTHGAATITGNRACCGRTSSWPT